MPDAPRRGRWPAAPVIYEIYPRSFRDTTGSGEGDLQGIAQGLDHVAALGVDAIWIAPFFLSPMDDGGYDIIDHCAVDPRYGTLADFDALVTRAHDLGLLVMIDQVLNHSSDRHENFLRAIEGDEGCAAKYVWRDPKPDGTPPNNWLSFFGPPAWTWNHKRQQYYLHQFLACQPCFDLRNQEVQETHRNEMRFWMDRGVDGFRLDAVTAYLFDDRLPDNPPADPETRRHTAVAANNPYSMQDHRFDLLPGDGADYARLLRIWAGEDVYLLGEINTGNHSVEVAQDFVGPDGIDAAYVIDVPASGGALGTVASVLERDQGQGSLAWWMTSHDQPRRTGTPADARFYALLNALMPGPMLIFQGEELALPHIELARQEVTDPFDLLYWPDGPGRENARVPMPWTETAPHRGFTSGQPWLPMRWPDGTSVAAGGQDGTTGFFREVLDLRRAHGFGRQEICAHRPAEDQLELRLNVNGASWIALFNRSGRAMQAPAGDPMLATERVAGGVVTPGNGAVWRI